MSAIVIIHAMTGVEEHRIDTTAQSERQRERTFLGVMRKTDLERFIVKEED